MGSHPSTPKLASEIESALGSLLDLPRDSVNVSQAEQAGADVVVAAAGHTFVVEVLTAAAPGRVAEHAQRAATAAGRLRKRAIPLLAVPFMTEGGRRAAEAARVAWFDFSGNAHIVAPGLRVIINGRPNRFTGPGRPSSIFAPKSARVVRWLLMHPERSFSQREIARSTGMTEGFVSRIVTRLEADRYVSRAELSADHGGRSVVRVRDASLLLDAWRDTYQFSKHTTIQGHVAARSGDALTRFVSDTLTSQKLEHAATGLAAAWQLSHFAAFRIASFFITREPSTELKTKLGFREDPRGANLWLVVPNDEGVFQGAEERDGVRCVHPIQAYLDLREHPERAPEAAQRLRTEFMNWSPRV